MFVGFIIVIAFVYAKETNYLFMFSIVFILAVSCRLFVAYYAAIKSPANFRFLSTCYVVASFILGLDISLLHITSYSLNDYELRVFVTITSLGLIAGAIGSLSVWMKAYLSFALPQLIAMAVSFSLNENYYLAVTVIIFSAFIIKTALSSNMKFKEGRLLITENIKLIHQMENEINARKKAQIELEENQYELEDRIKERTVELEKINESLNEQIGARRLAEKQLEHIAYHDELTNLPNRNLFIESVKKSLEQAKRNNTLLGVLFIDLDRFKNINESYGHPFGDLVLKNIAVRLQETLRNSDTIARNGSDEFSVLIENMNDAREPFVVAKKIIKSLNERFNVDSHTVHVGASVGIAMYPLDGKDAQQLVEMADTAMYQAKKLGRNNFQFYSSSMSSQITDRLMLENSLRDALENDEFFLVYQPQVNIFTKETVGFEALIRWNSPEFGIVSPIKFIPILEETGLIYSIGEWIILEVLQFIKSGKSHNTKVSINLSALQCGLNEYSKKIKGFVESADIDPALVEFEITETLLINDFNQTEVFLSDISRLGCTIALDDFGAGYTSFSYLTKLPIDVIKIDRSLITDIHVDKNLQDIVLAIVTMSKSLGIENVFEGVETQEELDKVSQLHNKAIIQGYFFSKPLELDAVHDWLHNETKAAI